MSGGRKLRRWRRAFARLDPVTREVFRLHAEEELAYEAIAARLGLTACEVERHIADAVHELARRVDRPWWQLW